MEGERGEQRERARERKKERERERERPLSPVPPHQTDTEFLLPSSRSMVLLATKQQHVVHVISIQMRFKTNCKQEEKGIQAGHKLVNKKQRK